MITSFKRIMTAFVPTETIVSAESGTKICRIDIQTNVNFIADSPVYEVEKPFYLHSSASPEVGIGELTITNVEWDPRQVTVHSRRNEPDISLEKSGFCYINHESKLPSKLEYEC